MTENTDSLPSGIIKLPTPQSDALSVMLSSTYSLFDPSDPDPLPIQIVKSAREGAKMEIDQTTMNMAENAERGERIIMKAASTPSMNTLRMIMAAPMMSVVDGEQRIRYGQVDAYSEEGDIDACLSALVNASAIDTVTCVHQDKETAQEVNDIIEESNLGITLKEIATSYVYNGNAFQSQIWNGGYKGTIVYNPKNVAVSKIPGFAATDLLYRPPNKGALDAMKRVQSEDLFYWALQNGWDEFLEIGVGAVPLDSKISSHIKSGYKPYKRYATPRLCRSVRPISTRQVLDDMRRATIEGVKNQLIFLKLENPSPKEISTLEHLIQDMNLSKTGAIVWRDNLTTEHLMPASIDALMATETWQQINDDIFRNMGIPVDVTGASSLDRPDEGVIKQRLAILLMEAANIQTLVRTIYLRQWADKFNEITRRNKAKAVKPSDFMFVPTSFDAARRIQEIIQPLATFGLISYQTAALWSGLTWDKELQQILREDEQGLREKIMPFMSFSQSAGTATGERSKTESISKPGRPTGSGEE